MAARAAAVAALLASAAYLWLAWRFPFGTLAAPGAGFFPVLVGGFLVAVAAVLVAATFRGWALAGSPPEESEPPAAGARGRVAITAAGAAGFCLLLPWAGYLLTAFLFTTALLGRLGGGAWGRAVLAGLAIAVASHYLFAVLLGVPLPRGLLGR